MKNSDALVLLAEDNDPVAISTTRFLEMSKYQVCRVSDGQAAIDAAIEHSPDIILMDIQMPGVDGLEAIKQIRKIATLTKTPIIAMTGLAMQGDSIRCLETGADLYLCKPYRMMQLLNAIKQLVQTDLP